MRKILDKFLWAIFAVNTILWVLFTTKLSLGFFQKPYGLMGIVERGVEMFGADLRTLYESKDLGDFYGRDCLMLSAGYLEYIFIIYLEIFLVYILFISKKRKI
jgi:hypothetical protein